MSIISRSSCGFDIVFNVCVTLYGVVEVDVGCRVDFSYSSHIWIVIILSFEMKVTYVHDFKFCHAGSASYTSVGMPEKYFDRFFDSGYGCVEIVSRGHVGYTEGYSLIENGNISFPFFCKSNYRSIFSVSFLVKAIKSIRGSDLIVINTPSIIGFYFLLLCFALKVKYVIEFAADLNQFESKSGGLGVTILYGLFINRFLSRAAGVTYVSQFLLEKFPFHGRTFVGSNVILEFISDKAKTIDASRAVINVCFVGGLNKRKGLLEILRAAKLLNSRHDIKFIFHLIGGHADSDWEGLVEEFGITSFVIFHGILTPDRVRELIASGDVYVQPSYSEGLPRATIEAMGCALPVIATNLPGFHDLIDADFMISPGDYTALAGKVYKLATTPTLYSEQSELALSKARLFLYANLHARRVDFYRGIASEL